MVYWIPINIPLSSFSAVRFTVVALIEKRYCLILVSLLICVLLSLSAVSISRNRIIIPMLSLLYMIYDFIVVLLLFVGALCGNGYWETYITQTIILVFLIILLCVYCWKQRRRGRTKDGSSALKN